MKPSSVSGIIFVVGLICIGLAFVGLSAPSVSNSRGASLTPEMSSKYAARCVAANMTWTPTINRRGQLVDIKCNPDRLHVRSLPIPPSCPTPSSEMSP